ncbi:hypothetical protein Q1695_003667 [Nippostrongylus brasiliensis]|nr:hypothetical protein Q1695_003667 [Nippostrongylus brasiliensis]
MSILFQVSLGIECLFVVSHQIYSVPGLYCSPSVVGGDHLVRPWKCPSMTRIAAMTTMSGFANEVHVDLIVVEKGKRTLFEQKSLVFIPNPLKKRYLDIRNCTMLLFVSYAFWF